jgi:mono/diheme cytochrome c family protein
MRPSASTLRVALLLGVACADFSRGDALDTSGGGEGLPDAMPSDSEGGSSSSYGADIHELLLDGCASCHAAAGAASGTGFLLSGNAPEDYPSTSKFVDVAAPAQSRLVVKMEGRGHTGGAIYTRVSPEYAQVLRWIGEGAAP